MEAAKRAGNAKENTRKAPQFRAPEGRFSTIEHISLENALFFSSLFRGVGVSR
jgi:hypothetical protein